MASSVNISIGLNNVDRDDIIDNIVTAEINRNIDFAAANPEILLPASDDIFHDQMLDHSSDLPLPDFAVENQLPGPSQPYDSGEWHHVSSRSRRRNKRRNYDRCYMEY